MQGLKAMGVFGSVLSHPIQTVDGVRAQSGLQSLKQSGHVVAGVLSTGEQLMRVQLQSVDRIAAKRNAADRRTEARALQMFTQQGGQPLDGLRGARQAYRERGLCLSFMLELQLETARTCLASCQPAA